MKKILIVILIILNTLLILSCASVKIFRAEPDEVNKTLLIGQIKVEVINYVGRLNGIHTKNIEIQFKNMENNEITILKSLGKDGWFYWVNPEVEKYKIFKIVLKVGDEHNYVSTSYSLGRNIKIEHGKVNNLGFLSYHEDDESLEGYLKPDFKHEYIKDWFKNKYPDSLWNDIQWVNITCNKRQ